MPNQDVTVIIVNYRTAELTEEAVRSVILEPEVKEAIVVNNTPNREDSNVLQTACEGLPVRIIESETNIGFGGGNNLAISQAETKYVFMLNSDAKVQKGTIGRIRTLLEDNKDVGLVAPPIYLSDGKTLQSDAQGSFPTPSSLILCTAGEVVTDSKPDWLSGVAIMARRDDYRHLKGFDEGFFMYYEDVDLCYRYQKILHKQMLRLAEGPGTIHLGGGSRQSTAQQKKAYFASQDLYLKKCGYSVLSRTAVRLIRAPYIVFCRMFRWS